MNTQLSCIMLVDDNESDNFFHQLTIENSNCAEKIICFNMAKDALAYLENNQAPIYVQPDIIFLDINMPGMNGWEFLEAYEKLEDELKSRMVIIMLTTSLSLDDRERAERYASIDEYRNKPLSEEYLTELVEKYFRK